MGRRPGKRILSTYVPVSTYRRIERLAREQERSLSEVLEGIIQQWMEQQTTKRKVAQRRKPTSR